jgi:hypothetical protein
MCMIKISKIKEKEYRYLFKPKVLLSHYAVYFIFILYVVGLLFLLSPDRWMPCCIVFWVKNHHLRYEYFKVLTSSGLIGVGLLMHSIYVERDKKSKYLAKNINDFSDFYDKVINSLAAISPDDNIKYYNRILISKYKEEWLDDLLSSLKNFEIDKILNELLENNASEVLIDIVSHVRPHIKSLYQKVKKISMLSGVIIAGTAVDLDDDVKKILANIRSDRDIINGCY